MPTSSSSNKKSKKAVTATMWQKLTDNFASYRTSIKGKNPHSSFRITRRRDYVRPLSLPNPLLFILEVNRTLWGYRKIFIPLMLIYGLLYAGLSGLASQETYSQITASIEESGSDVISDTGSAIEQAGLTFLSIVAGNVNGTITESQQIFGVLLALLAWLTTVWLLRNILAGHKVKVRDGLYSAGSPIISTAIIVFIIVVQLLPVALAAIGYAAATNSGLVDNGGVPAMLFWIAAGLLGLLSMYWISASLFAMVIVTLPGMYPLKALATSRDIMLGRRLKILGRVLWMLVFVIAVWVVTLIPLILFDGWIKSMITQLEWVPIVPVAILLVSTFSVFWSSTYIYLLYRKVVDNE